jgi:hypothetical protein|tara:strand:+ start:622 stop:891 length:270 start_codon:yes stop_codon:yes gene_type:complete
VRREANHILKLISLQPLFFCYKIPYGFFNKRRNIMPNTEKYKSLSVGIEDWKELGSMADKTNRTRSKMLSRLIRFYKDNRGEKKNGKAK